MSFQPNLATTLDPGPVRRLSLARSGAALLDRATFIDVAGLDDLPEGCVEAFADSWNDLVLDRHMADGGLYRRRRHGIWEAAPNGGPLRREPHRPHFQERAFNALNGGVQRRFEPISQATGENAVMRAILGFASSLFGACSPSTRWHVEAHQFRIEALPGGGEPTPEGVHRDGVDFVLITLIRRSNVLGGVTNIFDTQGTLLTEFTLLDAFDSTVLDDRRVLHGVSAVERAEPDARGYRDVLVLTFKGKT
jgi:hypothetical protein